MASVVALVISGVWGAIAWAVGSPDPMFHVLSVRTAPVRAALVSFAEPQYRNAVEVHMATRLLSQRRLGQRLGGYYRRLRS
jgi:hypothetical protein